MTPVTETSPRDTLRCMKRRRNTRADPALGTIVATVGAGALFAIPAILVAIDGSQPHYHWAWPTNWMAVPLAILVIGVVLLVVPLRWVDPPRPAAAPGSGASTYSITLICAELQQWQGFLEAAAKNRWIRFSGDMPAAGGLAGDDGSARYELPEPLKVNLIRVYSYLAALAEAHDRIKGWQGSDEPPMPAGKRSEDSGLGEVVTDAAAKVLVGVGTFVVRYSWLGQKLKRAQLKDREYQKSLQALPGVLRALRGDLETVAAGGSTGSAAQAPVELPWAPVISTSSRGSIDFEPVPVKSYI